MKAFYVSHPFVISLGITLGVMIFLCSCEVFHFEKPQPSDVGNIFVVPKEFRGVWQDDQRETTVTLGEKSFKIEGYDSMKVVNRISSQLDTTWGRHYLKSLQYNQETKHFDTVSNYVIKGNKIYEIRKVGLESGFNFRLKKDTIYFKKDIILDFELNQKAFLRKLTDTRYILNIHEENLWPLLEGRVGPWWQIVLMELTPDGKINFRDIDDKVKGNASLIYSNESDYYFDVSWAQSALVKLMDQGLFATGKENLHRISKSPAKSK